MYEGSVNIAPPISFSLNALGLHDSLCVCWRISMGRLWLLLVFWSYLTMGLFVCEVPWFCGFFWSNRVCCGGRQNAPLASVWAWMRLGLIRLVPCVSLFHRGLCGQLLRLFLYGCFLSGRKAKRAVFLVEFVKVSQHVFNSFCSVC